MTHEPSALSMLAAWLRPVLTGVNEESIRACRSWVEALANPPGDLNTEELALAAFGRASGDLLKSLEARIAAAAVTYAPGGNAELVAHIAAASLMHLLEARDAVAINIACQCESLLFLGWAPVIDDLPNRIRRFANEQARSSRSRIQLDPTVKSPRRRPAGEDATAALTADLADTRAQLGRAIDTIESVVNQFNIRLMLLDEEVDALWWARSDRSAKSGTRWTELTTLQRAVLASIDISAIVGPHPPTAGTLSVMNQVIGASDTEFQLIEVMAELHEKGWRGQQSVSVQSEPFYPLSVGVAAMARFGNDTTVVEKILSTTLLVAPGHVVSAGAVAEQILNEQALRYDDD